MTKAAPFAGLGVLAAATLLAAIGGSAAAPGPERGDGMVAADHELASRAGAEVMARGGNAVDAAVAAALAAGVVQPGSSGFGGGGFAVWVDGDERGALDFREVAPAAAHRDLFRTAEGGIAPKASREGGLAVGVPGEPRGLYRLLVEHGTMSPKQVAAPAIRLAEDGFPVGAHLAEKIAATRFTEVQSLFATGGVLPQAGEVVRRPDLARTLKQWVRTRGDVLNTGEGAQALVAVTAERGGILTAADLAAYAPKEREPVVIPWRGYTIVSMAPPSSGGVLLEEMLRALEDRDLAALGWNSAEYVHVVVEVMKHAYADRARFLGDPDFVDVPVERLLSDDRRDEIRAAYMQSRTFSRDYYGMLFDPPSDGGTEHISVVDPDGFGVALTTTINTTFGSGVVVPGLGVILNDEMDDFAAAPGVPNAYGLVGAETNRIEPGKRPLSSTTPTVVLDGDGRVVVVIGASGGSFIPSSVLQVLLDVLVFEMDPYEAVAAPRFHHQWLPETLMLEPGFPPEVAAALTEKGHRVERVDQTAVVQVVVRQGDGFAGVSDPRKGGVPAGVSR